MCCRIRREQFRCICGHFLEGKNTRGPTGPPGWLVQQHLARCNVCHLCASVVSDLSGSSLPRSLPRQGQPPARALRGRRSRPRQRFPLHWHRTGRAKGDAGHNRHCIRWPIHASLFLPFNATPPHRARRTTFGASVHATGSRSSPNRHPCPTTAAASTTTWPTSRPFRTPAAAATRTSTRHACSAHLSVVNCGIFVHRTLAVSAGACLRKEGEGGGAASTDPRPSTAWRSALRGFLPGLQVPLRPRLGGPLHALRARLPPPPAPGLGRQRRSPRDRRRRALSLQAQRGGGGSRWLSR